MKFDFLYLIIYDGIIGINMEFMKVFHFIIFINMNRDFNIITGEVKKEYPLNSTSRRFSSQAEIKKAKEKGDYNLSIPNIRRLGTSSDSKAFMYGYNEGHNT